MTWTQTQTRIRTLMAMMMEMKSKENEDGDGTDEAHVLDDDEHGKHDDHGPAVPSVGVPQHLFARSWTPLPPADARCERCRLQGDNDDDQLLRPDLPACRRCWLTAGHVSKPIGSHLASYVAAVATVAAETAIQPSLFIPLLSPLCCHVEGPVVGASAWEVQGAGVSCGARLLLRLVDCFVAKTTHPRRVRSRVPSLVASGAPTTVDAPSLGRLRHGWFCGCCRLGQEQSVSGREWDLVVRMPRRGLRVSTKDGGEREMRVGGETFARSRLQIQPASLHSPPQRDTPAVLSRDFEDKPTTPPHERLPSSRNNTGVIMQKNKVAAHI
ncbi:hypothetical protein JOL62DRAFT_630109 [Phyllosticta paracitricarpa]|uniref:Uncharacterized protein n=1 Tax=Phyllosticta paracitricarpa TaxID=2016321 RepID=A0ABR1MUI4_9PEZI